jgi:sugar lactone lactonase YvrE
LKTNFGVFSKIDVLPDVVATLGEGPMWHSGEQVFYWVDITGKKLHRLDLSAGTDVAFDMGSMISTVAPVEDGGVVVALETGVYRFTVPQQLIKFADFPDDAAPNTRFNDGKCDPAGRLWIGTMEKSAKPHQGKLYRIDGNRFIPVLENITISNGLAWSPDHRTMYYIDTYDQVVYAFDYDNVSGDISGKRVVVTIPHSMGSPDGMTIDNTGKLWVALWGGGSVACLDPRTGQQLEKIEVAAPHVTSCAFGGSDMNILVITTAREGLNEQQLTQYPLSGKIFFTNTSCRGIKPNFFKY